MNNANARTLQSLLEPYRNRFTETSEYAYKINTRQIAIKSEFLTQWDLGDAHIDYPRRFEKIHFECPLTTLKDIPSTELLDVSGSHIENFKDCPPGVEVLIAKNCQRLKTCEGLPESVSWLYLSYSPLTKLEGFKWPLQNLDLEHTKIKNLVGMPLVTKTLYIDCINSLESWTGLNVDPTTVIYNDDLDFKKLYTELFRQHNIKSEPMDMKRKIQI